MYQARIGSPFGPLLICAGAKGVTGLYFSDQKDCPKVAGAVTARADSLRPSSGMAGKVPLRTLRPVRCAQHKAHIGQGPHYQDLAATAPQLLQENVPETVRDLFNGAQRELLQYFAGTRTQFGFPLDFSGTPFQSKVWRALCNVPYGQVISYGQLALRAGLSPRHGRAVGAAVGRNPLAIVVPCHRIVGADQTLTGYTGGLSRKVALLQIEGFELS